MTSKAALVRDFIEAFNRLDIDSMVRHLDPAVELHEWPTAPGAGSYRGHDGVQRALRSWFESWEWMEVEILDIVETDDRVMVTLHQRAKGRGSQVEVDVNTFNVYAFRDGRVTRIELFTEREPALAATGLSSSTGGSR